MTISAPVPLKWLTAWRFGAWALVVAIWILSLIPPTGIPMPSSDKSGHFIAYFVTMAWFILCYRSTTPVAGALIAMGILLEFLQGLTGYRTFDPLDMLANSGGVITAWILVLTPYPKTLGYVENRLLRQ